MYAAAGNPRRTQSSGKKTIYGWTLKDTRWHGCHAIASQNVAAIQPQDGPGHERGVFDHEENRLDHVCDGARSGHQSVVNQGLFLIAGSAGPSRGCPGRAGFERSRA